MTTPTTTTTDPIAPEATIPDALWPPFWEAAAHYLPPACDHMALQDHLTKLYRLLVDTNRHTNLTRIADAEGFLTRHILDAWTLLPLLLNDAHPLPPSAQVMDVGSGAGFPVLPLALVLATVRPDITLHAVDSVKKKIAFIQNTATALGLTNLHAHHARVDELARQKDTRGKIDAITARGFAALPTLLELALPCLTEGGHLFAQKTRTGWDEELDTAKNALKQLKAKVMKVAKPEHGGGVIGVIRKIGPTPTKFPRAKNLPRTKPLS